MEIIKIIAMAVTGVVLASLMKTVNKEMSIYIIISTVILIFLSVAGTLTEIFDFLENIYSNVTYGRTFFPVIIKILAVAYITDFTSQLCKDAGEGSIGTKVEFAGKIMIFYLALPVLSAILEMISSLLQM